MEYSFDLPEFDNVTEDAKDLINNMITIPEKRFSA